MKPSRVAALVVLAAVFAPAQEAASKPASRAASAESFPFYARVARNDVNVRGGASDAYSPVARLKTGTPLRATARMGEWYKVEVPGGLGLWVAAKAGGKALIEGVETGVGSVVARDLQIRGTPDTNEPSLGELNPGVKLEILGTREDWLNVLMPTSHAGYVSTRLIKAAPDQAAAEAEFVARDQKERGDRRMQSSTLTEALRLRDLENARVLRAETALDRYRTERKKPALDRDVKGAQEALEAVVAEAKTDDDPYKLRAQAMLDDLNSTTQLEEQLRKAKVSQAEAERKAKESQLSYEADLERLKKRKEDEAANKDRREKAYVAVGFVRLATPIPSALESTPKYALHRGSQREYYLVSDKYQLSDYNGKHVGILEADPPEEQKGAPIRILRVKKLEIIAPGAE
jgi:uncharacterized protein YgiM (DUF1202 family)